MFFKNLFKKNDKKCPPECQLYTAKQFEVCYPKSWLVSNEDGILNFYPSNDESAITISTYKSIQIPWSEMKEAMLEMNQYEGDPEAVQETTTGNTIEYTFEYLEGDIKWYVKGVRRDDDFFLITINCFFKDWMSRAESFLEILSSFRLR